MKFSIIIASFNQVDFIDQAIKSVLDQTYQNFELIIIDGMSSDGSQNIINKYDDNQKVTVVIEKDKGLYHARNKGLLMATGDLIGFLNTDDFYEKDALKNIGDCFVANPKMDVIYGYSHIISKDGTFVKFNGKIEYDKEKMIKEYMALPDEATFFRRINLTQIGLFDPTFSIVADWDFWMRAMRLNLNFFHLDKYIANYRHYEETLTFDPTFDKVRFQEVVRLYRKYNNRYFTLFVFKQYLGYYIKRPLKQINFINKLYYSIIYK